MLTAGARLGPYEIVTLIGRGGMGEVYRAHDARLGRDVAVKVLPAAMATDRDRLRRFEQEARAASALNHPNILTVYDIGSLPAGLEADERSGAPYLVTELLEGATLRERLAAAPLTVRKAVDYASQIARGLSVAHAAHVVHRDLKPENLFVTTTGLVKILDFGLAKLLVRDNDSVTGYGETLSGTVLGTVGYMAPEQIRGQPVDQRADIFALGVVIYEMVAGAPPFARDTAADTLSAILTSDPPEMGARVIGLVPGVERIVRRCLEKEPAARFQSASDLGFALESVVDAPQPTPASAAAPTTSPATLRRLWSIVPLLTLVVGTAIGIWASRSASEHPPPGFRQLTFRRGTIPSARFAPDGRMVVYAAAWEGQPIEVFSAMPGTPESRSLGYTGASVLAISPTGEIALSMGALGSGILSGTLARAALGGGAPRELMADVNFADWTPDGRQLVVVRGRNRLEFSPGKVIRQTSGWFSHPRVSPNGDVIAVLEHPIPMDAGGSVQVVDISSGATRTVSPGWANVWGLAWGRSGKEIWFSGAQSPDSTSIWAVTLTGRKRMIAQAPGVLELDDVSSDGHALLTRMTQRAGIMALAPGAAKERDLSWLDSSTVQAITPDGQVLLISEGMRGAYIRRTDGSPAVRIGGGMPLAIAPDGGLAVALNAAGDELTLLPTGAGEPRALPRGSIVRYSPYARWFPNGQQLLIAGSQEGQPPRLYIQDISAGDPRAIEPSLHGGGVISRDGTKIAARNSERAPIVHTIRDGTRVPLQGVGRGDVVIEWSRDGRSLYAYEFMHPAADVFKLEVASGRKTLWKTLAPPDPAGIEEIHTVVLALDTDTYAYTFNRTLAELYVMDPVR